MYVAGTMLTAPGGRPASMLTPPLEPPLAAPLPDPLAAPLPDPLAAPLVLPLPEPLAPTPLDAPVPEPLVVLPLPEPLAPTPLDAPVPAPLVVLPLPEPLAPTPLDAPVPAAPLELAPDCDAPLAVPDPICVVGFDVLQAQSRVARAGEQTAASRLDFMAPQVSTTPRRSPGRAISAAVRRRRHIFLKVK
jgi:hypothetical protein